MKFASRLALVVASLAMVASTAQAQWNPGATTSSGTVALASYPVYSPYGTLGLQLTGNPGQPVVDAWCTDVLHSINGGLIYSANFTRLDAGNPALDARTRFGSAALTEYTQAAYLMPQLAAAGSQAAAKDIHCAIWSLFAATPAELCSGANTASYLADAGANYGSVNMAYWFVVSGAGIENPTAPCPQGTYCDFQEMMITTVPEPASMGLLAFGLVGLAGASAVRRRRRQ